MAAIPAAPPVAAPDPGVDLPLNPAPPHGGHEPPREAARCASCETPLQGPYCHACGEKRLGPHDYAFAHWIEHAVDAFTHFDLKVPRSLWSLVRRPGAMTADVLAGRRRAWATPFQVFLFANLIYYALASWLHIGTFETPLEYHFTHRHGDLARRWSEAQAAAQGLTMAAYAERFDALAHTLSKTLIVFFVPVFTALFALLHRRPRRFALEHVTAGLQYTSLMLLLMLVPYPFVVLTVVLSGVTNGDGYWTLATSLLFAGYAAVFFRRVYGGPRWSAALKALAVPLVFYVVLILVYRPLLFFVVHTLL